MADLTAKEKKKLETLFGMRSGYVLNFSNRTFQEFVLDTTNKDIYDDIYAFRGDSKANRLRAFWQVESNYVVGKLISALLEQWMEMRMAVGDSIESGDKFLYEQSLSTADRLQHGAIDDHLATVLVANADDDKDFTLLARTIRESLDRNEPEAALDRLHTFMVRYLRRLCEKHGIAYDRDKPLHSLYGEYVKKLKQQNLIESDMAQKIVKYATSLLDAFNDVRNNRSLAHDNPLLSYSESMLIFRTVGSLISFIESIEAVNSNDPVNARSSWEIPF